MVTRIMVDSREKQKAIKNILKEFDKEGITHVSSKLYVGDYMNCDNPNVIVDRKQNLSELCSNVCQGHERFRRELIRAQEFGIELIFLVEHGKGINSLVDVIWWDNPRSSKRIRDSSGKWKTVETKAMTGEVLYKILCTMEKKYQCKFVFCDKEDTGKRIIELLGSECPDKR